MRHWLPAWLALILILLAASAEAQIRDGRASDAAVDQPSARGVAFDSVIAVQDYALVDGGWDTQVIVDVAATVEVLPRVQLSLRPVVWRVGGRWETLADQASLRYEFTRGSRWRIEAGRFPSPIGLGMTENRANLNDGALWCHRPYYGSLPQLGDRSGPVALVSAVYPDGVQVATSSDRWDARAAIVDRAPVDTWQAAPVTSRHANAVVGGGVSPRQGLRLGVATAWGRSADAGRDAGQPYVMVNVEGEAAFGHTKVSGEWVRDRFDVTGGAQVAQGLTIQARQALTPRVFVHGRATVVRAPRGSALAADVSGARRDYLSVDTTAGYRITPDATVRLAHAATRAWTSQALDHQVGVSLVWSKRWW